MRFSAGRFLSRLAMGAGCVCALAGPAAADKIKNPVAVFAGLDKITGRIIAFDVNIDETVQFGSLQITPRVCYTRPQTEAPQTDGFVEVDEIQDDKTFKRIFSGWMFAASPGLNGVEHPVYDVWLTDCKGGTEIIKSAPPDTADSEPPPNADVKTGAAAKPARRRVDQSQQGQGAPGQPGAAGQNGLPPIAQPSLRPGGGVQPLPPPVDVRRAPGQAAPLPPADIPEAPRRAPTRRYFPSEATPVGPDPAGR
ncbi:MAG: DUF2155 domain-containing protein [Hyphomicrobiales bacterium]|nr:DUF2155 domain-containing protein [Hyphomicrobiales bacterium]